MATVSWAITSFSRNPKVNGPRLEISSVTFPLHPAWIVGAVRWTIRPARARVLFPSMKQIESGVLLGRPDRLLGLPEQKSALTYVDLVPFLVDFLIQVAGFELRGRDQEACDFAVIVT